MALLENSYPTDKRLSLQNDVLKTNGALASMQAPSGWSTRMTMKSTQPGYPPETFFIFSKPDETKTSIGVYFSGVVLDSVDGRLRREKVFDRDTSLQAGTAEASKPVGGDGFDAKISWLQKMLLAVGEHAVQSDEKYCRAIRSTDFNGLKSVIYEFQNDSTGTRTIEYCIDVLGTGQVVYSLYYRSAVDSFSVEMDTAVAAFKSSVWTKDFDPMVPLDAKD